ncbi:hypothetical protein F2P81_003622 [Scophthalmus maximus]|uniref:Uncharacterized protein n=1 Tax=Scophthalmus maximus TaxID=52904 RepID=A0A6A4TML7_SCOMX|nr:hypothetical protein F2P81_003622 [Scophthalmus maximus]
MLGDYCGSTQSSHILGFDQVLFLWKCLTGPKGPSGTSIPSNYCNKCQGSNKKTGKSGPACSSCRCTTVGGEEKEDGAFTGAEELFGTTSESDTSTFHGFEDDELEEPATNSNGISNRHR